MPTDTTYIPTDLINKPVQGKQITKLSTTAADYYKIM
jgi:hypothetical protein